MAAERQQNLQDAFLNHVRKNKTPLTIFLVNGVKLQGIVTWFDNFCVLLRRDGHSQLVYKHAISTIMPGGPISFLDADQNEDTLASLRKLNKEQIAALRQSEGERLPSHSTATGLTPALVVVPVQKYGPRRSHRKANSARNFPMPNACRKRLDLRKR